jgi:hypothetical protein
MPVPVEDDARRYSSISNNSDDGAACSGAMGCSHPHIPLVRCNAMAWTDETEGAGDAPRSRRGYNGGDGGGDDA